MRWKGLMAALLGLLIVGVTAGSAIAENYSLKKSDPGPTPEDVIGVGPPYEYWKITSVSGFYTTYGPWRTCVSGYGNPSDVLKCSFTYTWYNTWSGSLQVSVDSLESAVGFSVTASGSKTVGAEYHYRYPGQHLAIQYRDVYNTKTVIQTKYCVSRLGIERKCGTATVYAKKWAYLDFRPVDLG